MRAGLAFTRRDRPAAGLGTRAELLEAYERHAGVAVDPAALRWWELAGTLRWGVICVMQAFSHLSGAMRSVEHAVIGRRACEVEWDLLELLDPPLDGTPAGETPRREPPPRRRRLHDRPTAIELLEASRGGARRRRAPATRGTAGLSAAGGPAGARDRAARARAAAEHTAVHAAALAAVGCRDERELARAIRDGALGERRGAVLAAVRATVRAKLEVANPAYLKKTEPLAKEEP